MERSHARTQDVVAKLSHVNLQSTVSVLNALCVVATALESESDYALLKKGLESVLLSSAADSKGRPRGLRTHPSTHDVQECTQTYELVKHRVPKMIPSIRDRSVDRFASAAFIYRSQNCQRY